MASQFSLRGLSTELVARLRAVAEASGESMNTTILRILEQSLGAEARHERLKRYATWTEDDLREFDRELRAQRTVDEKLWK